MTELIVALDCKDACYIARELYKVGIRWFKLGPQCMVYFDWNKLIYEGGKSDVKIFLDLKLCDTAATVREAVKRFADAGIAAVSTFTEDATEAAMEVAPSITRVWRVAALTDHNPGYPPDMFPRIASGVICPGWAVEACRDAGYMDIVVPGVRHSTEPAGGHKWTVDPRSCHGMGVTHAVVGRPIYAAPDPVAAAREFIEALVG